MVTVDPAEQCKNCPEIGVRYRLEQKSRDNIYSWQVVHVGGGIIVSGQSWADAKDHFDRLEQDYQIRKVKRKTGVSFTKFD